MGVTVDSDLTVFLKSLLRAGVDLISLLVGLLFFFGPFGLWTESKTYTRLFLFFYSSIFLGRFFFYLN